MYQPRNAVTEAVHDVLFRGAVGGAADLGRITDGLWAITRSP